MLYVFRGHFIFLSCFRITGWQALSKAPARSSARRQHFIFRFLMFSTLFVTVSLPFLPSVRQYTAGSEEAHCNALSCVVLKRVLCV